MVGLPLNITHNWWSISHLAALHNLDLCSLRSTIGGSCMYYMYTYMYIIIYIYILQYVYVNSHVTWTKFNSRNDQKCYSVFEFFQILQNGETSSFQGETPIARDCDNSLWFPILFLDFLVALIPGPWIHFKNPRFRRIIYTSSEKNTKKHIKLMQSTQGFWQNNYC